MLPSTNFRSHTLILRDGREINITYQQYQGISLDKQTMKATEITKICDADTKETLYEGEIGAIKEFKERKKATNTAQKYFCDYGIAHPMWLDCNCQERYGIFPNQFKAKMYELFGHKEETGYAIMYPQDLTSAQRDQILKSFA